MWPTGTRDWDKERELRSAEYWRKYPIGYHPNDFSALAQSMAHVDDTKIKLGPIKFGATREEAFERKLHRTQSEHTAREVDILRRFVDRLATRIEQLERNSDQSELESMMKAIAREMRTRPARVLRAEDV